jgi:hypothetical protein
MLCLSSSNVWGLFEHTLPFRIPQTQLNEFFFTSPEIVDEAGTQTPGYL